MKIIYRVSVLDEEITRQFANLQERSQREVAPAQEFHPEDRIGRALLDGLARELPPRLAEIFETHVEVRIMSADYGTWEIFFAVIAAISAYHDLVESLELIREEIQAVVRAVLGRHGRRQIPVNVSHGAVVAGRGPRQRQPASTLGITALLQLITIALVVYLLISSRWSGGENKQGSAARTPATLSVVCSPAPSETALQQGLKSKRETPAQTPGPHTPVR